MTDRGPIASSGARRRVACRGAARIPCARLGGPLLTLLFLLNGCGYASYYPQPIGPHGMLDTGLPPEADTNLACGAPTGETVQVIVHNQTVLPYALYERDADCAEGFRGELPPDGDGAWQGRVGNLGVVRDEQGALVSNFEISDDGSGVMRVIFP